MYFFRSSRGKLGGKFFLSSKIYFDYNATTPLDSDLKSLIMNWVEEWGNPSSVYSLSRVPKKIIRESRQALADLIGCHPLEIIFTSGGSEANNLAIKGILHSLKKNNRTTLISSTVEHPSVSNTFHFLKTQGWNVIWIPVDHQGQLDQDYYLKALEQHSVGLVSVMAANNETGVIYPVAQLAEQAHKYGALFHCDGVQIFGKKPFQVQDKGVDMISFSAHKFYSLKGAGGLFCRKGLVLESLIHGGGQERSRRAGTENVLAIASMGEMAKRIPQEFNRWEKVEQMRDFFEQSLTAQIDHIDFVASQALRLPNTSLSIIYGVDSENLLMNLDLKGFEVSTGSACSSGSPEPNPILLAMDYKHEEALSSLRVSLGKDNTFAEVNAFLKALNELIPYLRRFPKE